MSTRDDDGQLSRWVLRALVIVMIIWVAFWASTDGFEEVVFGGLRFHASLP